MMVILVVPKVLSASLSVDWKTVIWSPEFPKVSPVSDPNFVPEALRAVYRAGLLFSVIVITVPLVIPPVGTTYLYRPSVAMGLPVTGLIPINRLLVLS